MNYEVAVALVVALLLVIGLFFWLKKQPKKLVPEIPSAKKEEAPSATPAPRRIESGLGRTREFFQSALDKLFAGSQGAQFYSDLEEILLSADVGISFAEKLVADLKTKCGVSIPSRAELKNLLQGLLVSSLPETSLPLLSGSTDAHPHVVMIVGINGAGKTTTIAKLCTRFQSQGRKVLVGGADTFRAAAMEQLQTWVERTGAEGVFQKEGTDPSAVAFDAVSAAISRKADICIVDTAGRLHTKANLMDELKKMKRVVAKALPGAPHDVWLVVDGATGQNALRQAKEFHEALGLTGVVVTKLDGSAKGGAVLALSAELKIPVAFIGVGEQPEDLLPFDAKDFVSAILSGL